MPTPQVAHPSHQLTPPSGELEYDLHHVAQHNADLVHPQVYDETTGQPLRFSEPEPGGLGVHFPAHMYNGHDGYNGHAELYPYEVYGQDLQQHTYSEMAVHTPPTPRSNTASEGGQRVLRSGRAMRRTDSPMSSIPGDESRITKSKSRKAKKGKVPVHLVAPLSVATKNCRAPVKDMESHINRPTEERRKETNKKGKTPRPMNSFMLYRAAYADRSKELFSKTNHQDVSRYGGASWRMEPPEIKALYEELAKIEAQNHKLAFPDYKFSPTKTVKKDDDERSEEEFGSAGIADPDGEYVPSRRAARQTRRPPPQQAYNAVGPQYQVGPYGYGANLPEWTFSNASGTPNPYDQGQSYLGQSHSYIHPTSQHRWQPSPAIEDMRLMSSTPASNYSGQALVGLPGIQHHDLESSRIATPMPQYQQSGLLGEYVGQGRTIYADQQIQHQRTDAEAVPMGQHTHFHEAIGDYGGMQAPAPQSTMHQDHWHLDPALGDPFEDSPYNFGLEEK